MGIWSPRETESLTLAKDHFLIHLPLGILVWYGSVRGHYTFGQVWPPSPERISWPNNLDRSWLPFKIQLADITCFGSLPCSAPTGCRRHHVMYMFQPAPCHRQGMGTGWRSHRSHYHSFLSFPASKAVFSGNSSWRAERTLWKASTRNQAMPKGNLGCRG